MDVYEISDLAWLKFSLRWPQCLLEMKDFFVKIKVNPLSKGGREAVGKEEAKQSSS